MAGPPTGRGEARPSGAWRSTSSRIAAASEGVPRSAGDRPPLAAARRDGGDLADAIDDLIGEGEGLGDRGDGGPGEEGAVALGDVADEDELGLGVGLHAARVHAELERVHGAAEGGIDEDQIRLVAVELVGGVFALGRELDDGAGVGAAREAPQPAAADGVVVDDEDADRAGLRAEALEEGVELG